MDDLETYRCRIGRFSSNHQPYQKVGLHLGKVHKGSFSFKLLFLVCFALSTFCSCQDPSIAKNPGPFTPESMAYNSYQEKTLFLRLRELNDDLVKLQSHETFLQKCLDREIIPNGLTPNSSYAIAKPHENLTYKLELLNNSNSFNSMKVIISHYQNEIFKLREEIQLTQQDLHTITTTSQYDFVLKTLQSFVRKTRNKYTFIKTKKLNRLIKSQSHTSARKSRQSTQTLWIPEFSLTSDDRQSILDGNYISDHVIDAAMALLHKQRPFFMFQSVCFDHQFLHYYPWESNHIHHDG